VCSAKVEHLLGFGDATDRRPVERVKEDTAEAGPEDSRSGNA
jgi:hypothetical protein